MEEVGTDTLGIEIGTTSKLCMDQKILNLVSHIEDENKAKLICFKRELGDVSLALNALQETAHHELSSVDYSNLTNESSCVLQKTEELSNKINIISNHKQYNNIKIDANSSYNNSAEFIFEEVLAGQPIKSKGFKDTATEIKFETRDSDEQGPTTSKITDSSNIDRKDYVEHPSDAIILDSSSLSTVDTSFTNKYLVTPRKELRVCLQRIDVPEEHMRDLSNSTGSKVKVELNRCYNHKPTNRGIDKINSSLKRENKLKTIEELSRINLSVRVNSEDCINSSRLQDQLCRASNIEQAQRGRASTHSVSEKVISNFSIIQNRNESIQSNEWSRNVFDRSKRYVSLFFIY